MVLPTVLILLLSWAAGLGGETRPRAALPGRAQRRGAGPRVSGLLSFCQLPQLASADPESRSPRAIVPRAPGPRSRRRRPELATEPRTRPSPPPWPGGPGSPAPRAPFPGAEEPRPAALAHSAATSAIPGSEPRDRADSQQLARLAARRVHCSGSERARRSGADPGPGVGRRCARPTRVPSLPIAHRSECLQPEVLCASVSVFCRPRARLSLT